MSRMSNFFPFMVFFMAIKFWLPWFHHHAIFKNPGWRRRPLLNLGYEWHGSPCVEPHWLPKGGSQGFCWCVVRSWNNLWDGMDCHVQALWFHELMSWCHMELLKLLLLEHIFRKRLCLYTTIFASTTPSSKMPLFLQPTTQTAKAGTRHQRSKASHSPAWSST